MTEALSHEELDGIDAWWRAANYLAVDDVIDRVPGLAVKAAYVRQAVRHKLIEHKQYIMRHGDDMPEIRDWKWPGA